MNLWRKIKPNCAYDAVSIVYGQILIHAGLLFGEVLVLPWLIETQGIGLLKICLLQCFGIFIYLNVMWRFWKIWTVNTSTVGKILPTLLKPDWFYCTICEANSPPRSFHCSTCNRCILKRDHHCAFTGKCIGYFTYQHYLYLIFYTWLGAWFAFMMGLEFTWTVLGGFSAWNLICFIFPIICFITGQISLYVMVVSFICLMACVFGTLLTILMIYHAKHVLFGLTTYERRHKAYIFDLGFKKNFLNVFGSRWYIAWMLPMINSPLPGDGIEFVKRYNYENPKDL